MTEEEKKEYMKDYSKKYYQLHKEEKKQHRKEYMKKYWDTHKEEKQRYDEEYCKKNKEAVEQRHQLYREKNKEQIKEYQAQNKERIKQYRKQYYKQNKEKIKQYIKQYAEHSKEIKKKYYEENKTAINKQKLNYSRQKIKEDIDFKLLVCLRSRLTMALKHNYKTSCTKELLDCTISEFRKLLEEQFDEGMSWDNYGRNGWHLDHILPCARFDFGKAAHQRVCFNYRNTQPMWGSENILKKASLQPGWQEKLYEICFALGIGPKQILDASSFPIGGL